MESDVRTGEPVRLAARVDGLRFDVVVFLSPSCRACINDVPLLNALAERLEDTHFVAVIEDADGFDFAADLSPAVNVVIDRDRRLQSAFDVRLFPHAVIIDTDGRIAAPAAADVHNVERLIHAARDAAESPPAGPAAASGPETGQGPDRDSGLGTEGRS